MSVFRVLLKLFAFILVTLILLPFQMLALWFKRPIGRQIPLIWHRAIAFILGFEVEIRGAAPNAGPCIFIANHISWSDIVIFGSITQLHFIAKSDVADWPLFGHLAKLQRTVFVERTRPTTSGEQVSAIGKRLTDGETLVLFAEGTTGDGLSLMPFKSSLVGAAHHAAKALSTSHVAIQPVAIAYTHSHGMKLGRTDMDQVAWVGDQDLLPHLIGILKSGRIKVVVDFADAIIVDGSRDRKLMTKLAQKAVQERFVAALRGPE